MSGWDFLKSHIFGIKEGGVNGGVGGGGGGGGGGGRGGSRPSSATLERAAEALGVTARVVSLGKAGLEEDPDNGFTSAVLQGEREMRLIKQTWMQEQMKKR